MRVQLWDNEFYYDFQRQSKSGANRDTHWQFNFKDGYFAELWDNGYAGFITGPGMFTPLLQTPFSVASVWNHLIMLLKGFSY